MFKATTPIIRFFSKKKEPYFFMLKEILGFKPRNLDIYKQAFVHRSALGSGMPNLESNERLEYLGDAMLGAAIADILYHKFPDAEEGFMTQKRSALVQRSTLDMIASKLKLERFIVAQKKLQIKKNSHVIGNAFEALIGAIYEDQGYEACKNFILRLIRKGYFNPIIKMSKNGESPEIICLDDSHSMQPKIDLLQWGQKKRLDLRFDVSGITTPNCKGEEKFDCTVYIENIPAGQGRGKNKKSAQAAAAAQTLTMIKQGFFADVEPSDPRHKGPKPSRKQRQIRNHSAAPINGQKNVENEK